MIERNRDERVPFTRPGMEVKGLRQPLDQPSVLVIFVPVLEADDRVEDLAIGAVTGARPLKMPRSGRAGGADESRVMADQ